MRKSEKIVIVFFGVAAHIVLLSALIWNPTGERLPGALTLFGLAYLVFIYRIFLKNLIVKFAGKISECDAYQVVSQPRVVRTLQKAIISVLFIGFLAWLIIDAWSSPIRLQSFFGMLIIFFFAFIISSSPHKVSWRPVIGGFILALALALFLVRWPDGNKIFRMMTDKVLEFLHFTYSGTFSAYGMVAKGVLGPAPFVFSGLQILLYFGAIVSVLYYFGIIETILLSIASGMRLTLGVTAVESLSTVACIFLGTTESILLIQPVMDTMTESEIHTIMTVGYACISGSLFAIYIGFGACPEYLLSATVMSTCTSLSISKLVVPEIKCSNNDKEFELPKKEEQSVIECICHGAVSSVKFVAAVAANLLVYAALLAAINAAIDYAGNLVGIEGLTFDRIVGYLFLPVAYLIGVSDATDADVKFNETMQVAELFGIKTTVNEFVAYLKLSNLIANNELKGTRAKMMATYALCGFTNIPMIGSQIAVLSSICPSQKAIFSKFAIRSFVSALIACLVTTCIAGMIIEAPISCDISEGKNGVNLTEMKSIVSNLVLQIAS